MKTFEKYERRGLPGGPNEITSYMTGAVSIEGYKSNSPDKYNDFNIIPSSNITMEDVGFPVFGMDNLGNMAAMMPGANYKFPGDIVFEMPMAQEGGDIPMLDPNRSISSQADEYVKPSERDRIAVQGAISDANSFPTPDLGTVLREIELGPLFTQKKENQREFDQAVNFAARYMSSPRYREMLSNSGGTRDYYNEYDIAKARINSLNSLQEDVKYSQDSYLVKLGLINPDNFGGFYHPLSNNYYVNENTIDNQPGVFDHELSHLIDKAGILIPGKDADLIKSLVDDTIPIEYIPDFVKYSPLSLFGRERYYRNYVTSPTETRARLNDIRRLLYDKGVDIFNNKVTPEDYDKLDGSEQPIWELRQVFPDESILKMLNEISMDDSQEAGLPMGQQGIEFLDPNRPISSQTNAGSTSSEADRIAVQDAMNQANAERADINDNIQRRSRLDKEAQALGFRNYAEYSQAKARENTMGVDNTFTTQASDLGMYNTYLPEITIQSKPEERGFLGNLFPYGGAEALPFVGEGIDAIGFADAAKKGNYGDAALYALGFGLPFVGGLGLKQFFKRGAKQTGKATNNAIESEVRSLELANNPSIAKELAEPKPVKNDWTVEEILELPDDEVQKLTGHSKWVAEIYVKKGDNDQLLKIANNAWTPTNAFVGKVDAARKRLISNYRSSAYKQRLMNGLGISSSEADDIIERMVKQVEDTDVKYNNYGTQSDKFVSDNFTDAHAGRAMVDGNSVDQIYLGEHILEYDDATIDDILQHEFGHTSTREVADFGGMPIEEQFPDLDLREGMTYRPDYYSIPVEARERGMSVLRYLDDNNLSIDDFAKMDLGDLMDAPYGVRQFKDVYEPTQQADYLKNIFSVAPIIGIGGVGAATLPDEIDTRERGGGLPMAQKGDEISADDNPLLPFSAEKWAAYRAGEITLLELTSDDRNIQDMPYYQDRYDFTTTSKYYENQDKPTIDPNTQRLIDEIYYPESLQFGTATSAVGLNNERENEIFDEIDKLRDDYYDNKITKADYEAKSEAYFDELERLNNEEKANYSFNPYKLGTPVKLDAEQARKNLKGPALDYFSSGDIYGIPVGNAYSTVRSGGVETRPGGSKFLGIDFTQGDGYAVLNDYLFPGTDKLAQEYILSKDPVLGLEDLFGMNPGTGWYSIDYRYPYEVTKEHFYLGNPTIEQIIDNSEEYKLKLDALTEQSRGPDTYLFSPTFNKSEGATFQSVNVPPGQPVELRSLPFDKDSYTGPLIPPKVDDYEYMEWERRKNPLTGEYEEVPVGPKYPQSDNYAWGTPVAFDKDSYVDRPKYPKSTKGDKLFSGDTYANVNPNFTGSGGMTSGSGTYQQDDIFGIENYGGRVLNNILYSPEYRGYEVETTTATLKPELEEEMKTFEEELKKETERRNKIFDDNFLLQYIGMENLSDQSFRTSGGKEFTELVDNTGKSSQGKTLYYYEDDNGDLLYVAPMTRWGTQNNQAGEDQAFLKNFEQFTTKDGKLKKPKMISERDNPEKFRQFARNAFEWGFENAEVGTLPTFQGQSNPGGGIMRKELMPTQQNDTDVKKYGGSILPIAQRGGGKTKYVGETDQGGYRVGVDVDRGDRQRSKSFSLEPSGDTSYSKLVTTPKGSRSKSIDIVDGEATKTITRTRDGETIERTKTLSDRKADRLSKRYARKVNRAFTDPFPEVPNPNEGKFTIEYEQGGEAAAPDFGSYGLSMEDTLLFPRYINYMNGNDESIEARRVYDKLNRKVYRYAKQGGMTAPDYIMTEVLKLGGSV